MRRSRMNAIVGLTLLCAACMYCASSKPWMGMPVSEQISPSSFLAASATGAKTYFDELDKLDASSCPT